MVSDAVAGSAGAAFDSPHRLEPVRIASVRRLWKRRGNGWHPVVEADRRLNIPVGSLQVRSEPSCRESLNDDLRAER